MTPLRIETTIRPRVESGPVQFDDDWPGTFIRGNQSMAFALALRGAVDQLAAGPASRSDFLLAQLGGLIDLLESCDVRGHG